MKERHNGKKTPRLILQARGYMWETNINVKIIKIGILRKIYKTITSCCKRRVEFLEIKNMTSEK